MGVKKKGIKTETIAGAKTWSSFHRSWHCFLGGRGQPSPRLIILGGLVMEGTVMCLYGNNVLSEEQVPSLFTLC